jgi:hypothetical protein
MKHWFSDMQKEVHILGPLLPSGYGITSFETQNAREEEGASVDIEAFLGEMLVQHGKRSVFFASLSSLLLLPVLILTHNFSPQISFGTIFYPRVSEYIEELIESLMEKKAPFVSDGCITFFMILSPFFIYFYHRFSLMHPPLPKFRNNKLKKSNLLVSEC